MVLSCRVLTDVNSVNSFEYAERMEVNASSQFDLYIQLIDASKNKDGLPPGLRYAPAAGTTLSIVLENLDAAKRVTRSATQPFSGDSSIWKLSVLSSDNLPAGTVSLKLTMVESSVTTKGIAMNLVSVAPKDL